LVLHAALLAGCLALGLALGLRPAADAPLTVLVGMLAVAAMATQNAMVKLAVIHAPSTAVMTTNTTQLIIDLMTLARSGKMSGDLDAIRWRAKVTFLCVAAFAGGCIAAAVLELHLGVAALVLPALLAALAVPWASWRSKRRFADQTQNRRGFNDEYS
jgi:uncharacterized membrane protein YoaK (UPF0700 family)